MFERLTERTSDGIAYTKMPLNESHLNKRGVIEQCFTGFVADRLAAYEDIGLSPEEITDMIYRFEAFLCEMTGNRMSKSNYTLDAMISAANDYQQSLCDGCWDRSELAKYYEADETIKLMKENAKNSNKKDELVKVLKQAREAIRAAWSDGSANAAMDKASEALAAINKAIGGKEDDGI